MALTRRLLISLLLATLCPTAWPSLAGATVRVPAGKVVRDLEVVGDDVRVEGSVRGRTLVIAGDLEVGEHGRVNDPTVIAGGFRSDDGASVSGEVFRLAGPFPALSGWQAAILVISLIGLRLLVAWTIATASGLLAQRPLLSAIGAAAADRPLRVVLVGGVAGLGLTASGALLAISVLGLPVALAMVGLLIVAATTGTALALSGAAQSTSARRVAIVALATPVVGDALAALAAIVGLGALLHYGAEGQSGRTPRRAVPAP